MAASLVSAQGVSKRFRIRENRSIVELFRRRTGPRSFFALQDVSLELSPGEVLAVIGRNGAGKSTLLKLCAGVSVPTTGTITRPSRIAPLIEVGAGFHPELTGRENIFVNGRLLGLSKEQLRRRVDDIVAFAELESSIDRPVRQYSSGMFMRLGFAVAIHTDPQLLIVDEVLAVGDLPFQVRCLDRIRELRETGVGILFVSHNLAAVQTLADRAMLLEQGKCLAAGSTREVLAAYYELLAVAPVDDDDRGVATTGEVAVTAVEVLGADGADSRLWDPGSEAVLRVTLSAKADVPESVLGVRLVKEGAGMVGAWLGFEGGTVPAMAAGESRVLEVRVQLNVGQGHYLLDLALGAADVTRIYFDRQVATFGVGAWAGESGLVHLGTQVSVLGR